MSFIIVYIYPPLFSIVCLLPIMISNTYVTFHGYDSFYDTLAGDLCFLTFRVPFSLGKGG